MVPVESQPPSGGSIGKGPRSRRPRRRRRLLTGVSRQRRAANARERRRVEGVNAAFLELRDVLPVHQPEDVNKVDTLRLAAKWIAHLTTVLVQDDRRRPGDATTNRLPIRLHDLLTELLEYDLGDFELVPEHPESSQLDLSQTPVSGCQQTLPPDSPDILYDTNSLSPGSCVSAASTDLNCAPLTLEQKHYPPLYDTNPLTPESCSSSIPSPHMSCVSYTSQESPYGPVNDSNPHHLESSLSQTVEQFIPSIPQDICQTSQYLTTKNSTWTCNKTPQCQQTGPGQGYNPEGWSQTLPQCTVEVLAWDSGNHTGHGDLTPSTNWSDWTFPGFHYTQGMTQWN